MHPAVNAREALSFVAWLICGAYLLASVRFRMPVVGALVVPVTMVLDVAARLSPSNEAVHGVSTLGAVHIILATGGIALFAVAAGGAVVYLVEERASRRIAPGACSSAAPALETLDTLNRRCITFGFPLFTVAVITGAVWGMPAARSAVHAAVLDRRRRVDHVRGLAGGARDRGLARAARGHHDARRLRDVADGAAHLLRARHRRRERS